MPNPVKRHSRTRRNMRRAHDFLTLPGTSKCPQCKKAKLQHRICKACGTYKGRDIITTTEVSA